MIGNDHDIRQRKVDFLDPSLITLYDPNGHGILHQVERTTRHGNVGVQDGHTAQAEEDLFQLRHPSTKKNKSKEIIAISLLFTLITIGLYGSMGFFPTIPSGASNDGKIVVQTKTFDLQQLSHEERVARRAKLLVHLETDPTGNWHRQLRYGLNCPERSTLCDGKIVFESGKMSEEEFNIIENMCEVKQIVNVRRRFNDGTSKIDPFCSLDSSITVKPKKNKKKRKTPEDEAKYSESNSTEDSSFAQDLEKIIAGSLKRNRKKKMAPDDSNVCNDREVVITTNNHLIYTIVCEDCICYQSGNALLSKKFESCDLRYTNDDCEPGLICSKLLYGTEPVLGDTTGICSDPSTKSAYVDQMKQIYKNEGAIDDRHSIEKGKSAEQEMTINNAGPNEGWWIDFENHKCVRDCKVGRGSNCGGRRPWWDHKVYASPRDCCSTHLSWKRFTDCVYDPTGL